MTSKRVPLSITPNEEESLIKELPKGEQFYLMAPYQRSKRQKIALIAAILLFFSVFPAFAIYLFKSASTDVPLLILFTGLWLISLLLFLYSYGVFDHSERWLSYVLIIDNIDINNENNNDSKIYLINESTELNYKITACLNDIQISDINIIEQNINSYFIQISNIIFNEFGVSNKNAAEFVNEVIEYLNEQQGENTNTTIPMKNSNRREEYKKISKGHCSAFGCDICSFNLCSNIIFIWFIIVAILFACSGTIFYKELCVEQQYDDIYDTKYDDEYYDEGCVTQVITLFNVWKAIWIIGFIISVFGMFGLYYLKEKWLIPGIIYVVDENNSKYILPVFVFIIQAGQIAVLVKSYRIIKSSMTVSFLKNRMGEMEEMINLKKKKDNTVKIIKT